MPRKLEAGLDGIYLICSVLITSTMKSEPATPPMRAPAMSFGVAVSAAATCMLGASAEGNRSGLALPGPGCVAALAPWGVTAHAAPAPAAPDGDLRRLRT